MFSRKYELVYWKIVKLSICIWRLFKYVTVVLSLQSIIVRSHRHDILSWFHNSIEDIHWKFPNTLFIKTVQRALRISLDGPDELEKIYRDYPDEIENQSSLPDSASYIQKIVKAKRPTPFLKASYSCWQGSHTLIKISTSRRVTFLFLVYNSFSFQSRPSCLILTM